MGATARPLWAASAGVHAVAANRIVFFRVPDFCRQSDQQSKSERDPLAADTFAWHWRPKAAAQWHPKSTPDPQKNQLWPDFAEVGAWSIDCRMRIDCRDALLPCTMLPIAGFTAVVRHGQNLDLRRTDAIKQIKREPINKLPIDTSTSGWPG